MLKLSLQMIFAGVHGAGVHLFACAVFEVRAEVASRFGYALPRG